MAGDAGLLPRGNHVPRVIIDERKCEQARVIESLHTARRLLIQPHGRDEPAKLDGKPVRYVKMIEVVLKPQ